MKNLYNKIYEAINTGIQKALVLDDEEDISMNYQHKKIVNNSNTISYFVEKLLNGSTTLTNSANYEQIIKYYSGTGYKYKVKDFNELKNIFNKIYYIENVSFEWISNLKDYISIILADSSEINFYEKSVKTPLFLKFANDDILGTENEILIYLQENHYISKEDYQWQTTHEQILKDEYLINEKNYGNWKNTVNVAEKNYDGYENYLNIQENHIFIYGETPAINYCSKLKVNNYEGYLPSIGQLKIMYDNKVMINYILRYLKLNEIKLEDAWWSSTEYSDEESWHLSYNGNVSVNCKATFYAYVFPLFARTVY
ncbi:MAG: hypothetical protein [Wendovervirus sonii]|uniref:Virion structural protein n=1 Tax=phage Lak_Megaphage_Sonny TaxID=3109229 RepID=A0ABZ0Z5F4_9CAUD|nr:MAG: hypothetical protein [phage Lak_Megaphage_Sonny]